MNFNSIYAGIFAGLNWIFFLFFLSPLAVQGQLLYSEMEGSDCEIDAHAFPKNGEHLVYKAFYNVGFVWVDVGETHFKIKEAALNGREAFLSIANAFNYNRTAWIYEVKDTYLTYLDKYTLQPLRFKRAVNEGRYSIDCLFDFDYDSGQVYIDHIMTQGKVRRADEWMNIGACAYDMMSAYHFARNLDYSGLAVGETVPFELFIDGEVYAIVVRYLGKEVLKTKQGRLRCIKFSPELIEGDIFADGDELIIYVSDDKNKIPVYLESELSIGKVKVYLERFENLRFPLDCKL